MRKDPLSGTRSLQDAEVVRTFFEHRSEASFEELFRVFTPQLIAFFRSRRCDVFLAEDLAQEVMLTVHRKSGQVRDWNSFRGWLFKVARRVLSRYYENTSRVVRTVQLAEVNCQPAVQGRPDPAGTPAFEFLHWIALLDTREGEVMKLRYVEQWEYHEIAAAQEIPVGTVQSRVFNAKRKLAFFLTSGKKGGRKAA